MPQPAAAPELVPLPDPAPLPDLGVIRRLTDALHLPLWQEARALTQRRQIVSHPLWQNPPLDAGGLPVLLVGGLGSTPRVLAPLQDLLHRFNCRSLIAPVRLGVGCGEATTAAVERALLRLVEATDERVVIIAHSRGGQFSRAVAVRHPSLVRGLITLGSPLNRLLAIHPLLRAEVTVLGLAGYLGIPGLMSPSCLWGRCCAQLRLDIAGPFPASVPFVSLYSREDKVVDWRSCLDPAARIRHVSATHGGLLWAPASLEAVSEELADILRSGSRSEVAVAS
jgi:pimeloyl-ACP methyl ester carboxylesterase